MVEEKKTNPLIIKAQNIPAQSNRDRLWRWRYRANRLALARRANHFLQPTPSLQPSVPEERPVEVISLDDSFPLQEIPDNQSTEQSTEVCINGFTGNTILDHEIKNKINNIIGFLEGCSVTWKQLQKVTNEITNLYLEGGYLTSRAIPKQVSDGEFQIFIIEGKILDKNIEIEGTKRLHKSYIRNRIKLGIGLPLNVEKLENQLRLLLADPLLKNVEATLKAKNLGESILEVKVTEADPVEGGLSFDNYSAPSIGSERTGISLVYRNLTGIGDQLAGNYYFTFEDGSDIWNFTYSAPLNPRNGTLQLTGDINRNQITQSPLDEFDIEGESERYEISYRQPLVRSPREEFALSLGFTFQDGQTFVFDQPTPFGIGPDEDGISRTSVFKFSQDYILRDLQGAWSFRSLFSFGTGLFDATTNDDPIPDGHFFSWLIQGQRVQRIANNQLLIVQLDLQLTPDSLLPSQQFVIGGGESVRGYRQNVRSGDNGLRLSIEDRITLVRDETGNSIFQVAPFIDLGAIWNVSNNPNSLLDQRFLLGSGLGILWQPEPKLNIRLDYGLPFVDLDDRGDNIQDDGLYFNVIYGF
ncbi:MAG: ShlB/FhaC/HecB family hemolysin secretion/activation protein [Symploca sp. SIO2B6]|nr:ShlB/FhaC/HecB family hemolysin secretion/activation protein [Symploca sp. SIO2B6]